ncbi:vegetative incompatibility protein HET-E-1 [Colletotrichum abscissum]|uniref:Vegetative incompatibility protein HET-E-1 n=2 Tax=Colletotrichum abscissum TaxID=1671311 RepID=A0A9P9XA58_9PEZI|nr:vegetative incompatibility protein HET-E-1 [Colletotrichum abscissum]
MLRALILQLSDQLDYVPSALQRIHDLRKKHNIPPSTADLLQCFRQVLQLFQKVYVVLDALDESPRETSRFDLLETLKEIRTWSELGLHLLITSRDEVDIREGLEVEKQATILMKHEGIDDDIASFVSQYLQRRLKLWKEHHALIEKVLTEKAHGVFRWVECQFKALAMCPRSKQALDRRLQSLPPTLDETYKRMLENVPDKDYAKQMLTILCCASRPLTVPELINALAIEIGATSFLNSDRQLPDADSLQEICPGFTEVALDLDTETVIIRIAHFSVQEYLESSRILSPEGYASFSIPKRCGNLLLASMCLTLLLERELQMTKLEEINEKYPFAKYAAKEWVSHWRKSIGIGAALYDNDCHCDPEVSHDRLVIRLQDQMLLLFRDKKGAMANWHKLWHLNSDWFGGDDEMPSPLCYAIIIGARFLVERLYEDCRTQCSLKHPTERCIDHMGEKNGSLATLLQAAAAFGHRDVVDFFLDKGADPNMKVAQTPTASGTPLMTASAHGQTEIIELLLKLGADVNAVWSSVPPRKLLGRGRRQLVFIDETPTALAAASRFGIKEAVKLLLQHGAVDDVHSKFFSALTATMDPIFATCGSSKYAACRELLFEKFDGFKGTKSPEILKVYMEVAAKTGNAGFVRKCLDKWILYGKPSFSSGILLQFAPAGGHRKTVDQLLQSNARMTGSADCPHMMEGNDIVHLVFQEKLESSIQDHILELIQLFAQDGDC